MEAKHLQNFLNNPRIADFSVVLFIKTMLTVTLYLAVNVQTVE